MFRLIIFLIIVVLIGSFVGWENIFQKSSTFIEENQESIEKGTKWVDTSSRMIVEKIQTTSKEIKETVDEEVITSDEDETGSEKIERSPDSDVLPKDVSNKKSINNKDNKKKEK